MTLPTRERVGQYLDHEIEARYQEVTGGIVTAEDIRRAARRELKAEWGLAGYGNIAYAGQLALEDMERELMTLTGEAK